MFVVWLVPVQQPPALDSEDDSTGIEKALSWVAFWLHMRPVQVCTLVKPCAGPCIHTCMFHV